MDQLHPVIYDIHVTKDIDNKLFKYIDSWGKILDSIEWAIKAS